MPFRYRVRKKAVGESPDTTRPNLGTSLKENENQLRQFFSVNIRSAHIYNAFVYVSRPFCIYKLTSLYMYTDILAYIS